MAIPVQVGDDALDLPCSELQIAMIGQVPGFHAGALRASSYAAGARDEIRHASSDVAGHLIVYGRRPARQALRCASLPCYLSPEIRGRIERTR